MKWFWAVVSSFTQEELARLLQFTTGSSQLPPGGFNTLCPSFQIIAAPTHSTLPTAHTWWVDGHARTLTNTHTLRHVPYTHTHALLHIHIHVLYSQFQLFNWVMHRHTTCLVKNGQMTDYLWILLSPVLTNCASPPMIPMRSCTRCWSWPSVRAVRALACSEWPYPWSSPPDWSHCGPAHTAVGYQWHQHQPGSWYARYPLHPLWTMDIPPQSHGLPMILFQW